MDEIWKPIPGYDGYEVSNLGQVRSYKKRGRTKGCLTFKFLNLSPGKQGYTSALLINNDGLRKHKRVHQLIMLAFIGPCPDGMEVCHNNDIKSDNRLDNLRYGTPAENMEDMIKNHNGIHPAKKHTVKRATRIHTKREKFIEIYNSCHSLEEVSARIGLKKKTVMEDASRLRRWGYDMKYFEREGRLNKVMILTKAKRLEILIALEAGEITEGQASSALGVDRLDVRAMKLDAISAGVKRVIADNPQAVITLKDKSMVYDARFGDDKICSCGHPYYRHFDSYEDIMRPVGCKYCDCGKFSGVNE